ncbi:HNH endonuclease family protein [Isoptericola variabilis]|uniref:GmrSD restriction endonucleases C-terminal domain-containing protein n=1 Tax=Isoptericola variabilis (strain 225) TaxID=743718 RepID=F6FX01_ISOV2|nr:HNH endonuclease family protein [Isoptericola variabilis]AEG44601.1 Domain of unknown function DUF1994-containing protein [Isoptericola variabilis 225]TWH28194.1 uncharacterized protein DUF1524 [Isoptericola variabilis J7]
MVTVERDVPVRREVPPIAPDRLRTRGVGRRRLLRFLLMVVALAVVLVEIWLEHEPPPVPAEGSALEALETLAVREPGPGDDYDRDAFGPPWSDVDANGCDTRNDILARDMVEVTYADATTACVVREGILEDPYTGATIAFLRGVQTSGAVQVDHVVALKDAWVKGASEWDDETRLEFANDPLNLVASDGPANMAKGARDAASWLPPATSFRCPYVARQVAVKVEYELAVSPEEYEAMSEVLSTCPAEPLPTG